MNRIIANTAPALNGKIATLGDIQTSITCSQQVAKVEFPQQNRLGATTFEEAASLVKDGHAELLLVPGAYPAIGSFLMDEDLVLVKAFKKKIPALVFGNTLNDIMAPLETIYHHAAVKSLLPKLPWYNLGTTFIASKSNEVAYEAMIRHGERAGCISNSIVFEYYNRQPLMTLRTERDMSWNVFAARKSKTTKGDKS